MKWKRELKEVKKNLLFKHKIFTGESKPNVIRLLPALNITKEDADIFLKAIAEELNAWVFSPTGATYW